VLRENWGRKLAGTRQIALAALLVAAVAAPRAGAAVDVSSFSVTPSTTQAGGHPNLGIRVAFPEPTTGVKDISFHLPPGLTANPNAFEYCSRRRLVRYICPPKSRLGSLSVTAFVYGIALPFRTDLYNMRPAAGERVRIGAPVPTPEQVLAAELPITERPEGGLGFAVTGIPQDVGGITVRVSEVKVWLKGLVRRKIKRRLRRRAFLTNPATCVPATSSLELTPQDSPGTVLTRTSSFTPTGCS
jgi:hypothetical protein